MRALWGARSFIAVAFLLTACGGGQVAIDVSADQEMLLGATAELHAIVERDGDWTYSWTLDAQPSGATATVEAQGAAAALTPSVAGTYSVHVQVSDGKAEGSATVQVTFLPNRMPTAVAGADRVVTVGERVELDGRASSDPDAQSLAFAWSFVERPEGSAASMNAPASRTPSFIADAPGRYVVELSVHDGGFTVTDRLTVLTQRAPIALPGPDLSGEVGQELLLDGSDSMDPDDDVLQFRWTLVSAPEGSTAGIADADRAIARFTPDLSGSYLMDLTVSDGRLTGNARLNVQALPPGGVLGSVVFVSPGGHDDNPGTQGLPLATIAAALAKVETIPSLYRIQLTEGLWSEPFAHQLSDLTVELVGPETGEARLIGPGNLFSLMGNSRMSFSRITLVTPGTAIVARGAETYVGLNLVECVSATCVRSGQLPYGGGAISATDSKLIGDGEGAGLAATYGRITATRLEVTGHKSGIAVLDSPLIVRESQVIGAEVGVDIFANAAHATILIEQTEFDGNQIGVNSLLATQVRIVGCGFSNTGTGIKVSGGAISLQDVSMSQLQVGVDIGGIANTGEVVTARGSSFSGIVGPAFRVNHAKSHLDLGWAEQPGNNQLTSAMAVAVWDKRPAGATGLITLSQTSLNGQPIPAGVYAGHLNQDGFIIEGGTNTIHVY